jgi:hypothetical protein
MPRRLHACEPLGASSSGSLAVAACHRSGSASVGVGRCSTPGRACTRRRAHLNANDARNADINAGPGSCVRWVVVVVTSSANAAAEKSAMPAAPIAILLKIFIVTSACWLMAMRKQPEMRSAVRRKSIVCASSEYPRVPSELTPRRFPGRTSAESAIKPRPFNPAMTLGENAVQMKIAYGKVFRMDRIVRVLTRARAILPWCSNTLAARLFHGISNSWRSQYVVSQKKRKLGAGRERPVPESRLCFVCTHRC